MNYPSATAIAAAIAAIALRLFSPNESNPLIQFQSGLQASLKPAQWIPKMRDIHRYEMKIGTFQISDNWHFLDIIHKAMEKSKLIPKKVMETNNGYIMEAYYYTPSTAWLDVVTLSIVINPNKNTMTINGLGESTGLLPLVVPFAPILNIMLCWLPFDDWGNNKRYLTDMKNNIRSSL